MTTDTITPAPALIARSQITRGTLLAISGGRSTMQDAYTLTLPVRYGYSVEIEYVPGSDLYTVRRVFARGLRRWTKAEWTGVYAEQLDEIAYRASCYLDA